MLRAALLLSFAPALLAGCSTLPEAAAQQTAISAATPWPKLLTTDEMARALPAERPALAPGAAPANTTEAELAARSARLKARAEALRRR